MKSETRGCKWRTAALAALGALWLCAGPAKAGPGGTADSITVTITPTASYAITITSASSGVDLGSVGLNSTTNTVTSSTVAITSSFAYTGLKLTGSMGGTTPWTLVSTNTVVQDGMSAWALFTDTSIVTAPASASVLTSSNAVVGTAQFVVGPTGSGGATGCNAAGASTVGGTTSALFESTAAFGLKHMECIPSSTTDANASKAHLFLYFKTPQTTSDLTQKLVTFTLTAGIPQ